MSTERIDLGERLSSLSPDELESLLRSLDQVERTDATDDKDATQHLSGGESGEGIFPATYAQILFWRQYDADRGGSNNHQSMAFRIRGGLDVEALISSFQILSDSQPSLRTVYFEDDRDVWQHIKPSLPIPFEFIDSDALPDIEEFLKRPFDLESEPPIRVRLVRENVDVHLLQIVLHHIASDGRSKVVMLQRLSEIYKSLKTGDAAEASIHASHLGRKAMAERAWLSDPASEETKRYWQESSFSKGMGHPWPGGRHRVRDLNTDPYVSDRLDLDLGEDLSQKLRLYAAERGMTPLQVMIGCYFLCLQRLVSGGAVTFGMPVDMRNREEDASMVGCFMNVVPVTMDAEPPGSIDDYLALAAERMRSAVEHARMPLYRILEFGFSAGHSARTLAWKTIVNFKEDHADALFFSGASIECLPYIQLGTSGDIALTLNRARVKDGQHSIAFSADIDVSKISLADASALLETWRSVMIQCVSRQVALVSDIDILLPGDRERLRAFSGLDQLVSYPRDKTLVDLFEEQVMKTPDAVALRFHEIVLTYRKLNDLANQLAHHLMASYDINADQLVGIELPRSEWMVIGMLAIIKTGGAYVPIDPDNPPQRKDFIRGDANIGYMLNMEELDRFNNACNRVPYPTNNPRVDLRPDNLVYVIYTSGTTGNPKGVLIEHRNVVRLLFNDSFPFDFSDRDVWTMFHNFNFDFSVWEMYGALLYGGELVVVPLEVTKDAHAFTELLIDRGVTVLNQTPSAFYTLSETVAAHPETHGHRIRYVIFGGEALQPSRLDGWRKSFPETRLINMYGITETTVHVTYKEIGTAEIEAGKSNIGRPIPTLRCHILDDRRGLCPPGRSGELYVGGAGLARGYLNREELTAERFIPDPFWPGERLYRTGDICLWREDGELEYLGRMDDQVKIRGYRIELGEVAHALLACDGLRNAVVRPEPDATGSNRLRAWVTVKEGSVVSASSIRYSLVERLPGYMIPFRIHILDSIPLTPQGKTDNRALRAIAEQQGEGDEGLPLTTTTEQRLAAIWSELLGTDVQHRDADFFRLGGHSLIAMRLAGRMHKEFGVAVSLPDFYTDSRLESLATSIDARVGEGGAVMRLSDMPDLLPGERVPMSWAQRRMWMLQLLLAQPSSYHIASTLPIPSGRNASETKGILQLMAERHGILRTRLWQEDEGFWQEEMPVEDWSIDWDELDAGSSEECISMMSDERDRHFDLSTNPGWRARWVTQAGKTPCLLLVFHHALTDEWSMNLFIKELEALLSDRVSASGWQKPAHRYIDFARWQHWTFSEGLRERLEAYWKQRLSALGEPVRIIPDHTLTDGTPGSSGMISGPFVRATYALMDTYCKKAGLSRFAVWMAVWQVLQARLGTGEEVVIATPVSERGASEWEDVLGMFLNTLPIRTKIDERTTFRAYSRQNHRQLAQDLKHGQLPYEDILRVTDIDLGPDSSGLPQVMFVLHGDREWLEEESDLADINPKQRYANGQLSIHIKEYDGGCRTLLTYDADRFRAETAESILRRFEKVTRQVLADPDIIIADIDILLPGERERIIELSGRANIVDHPRTTLHEVFRQTANRYPDRPAVIEANGSETNYAGLQDQVFKVAAFLKARGIGNGLVVGVHMHRSPALLATILGVSEAGGAFLLLERSLPLSRLRTMAEESRAAAVITESDMPILPGFEQRSFVFDEIPSVTFEDESHGGSELDPHALAYVIFTSGSTGVPKGAMVEQMNLISYFYSIRQAYDFGPGHRTLLRTPLSFDACLIELMLPLFSGGAVVMSDEGAENDMQLITELMAARGISHLFCVPSILGVLLDEPGLTKTKGILQMIISGGESFQDSLMRACQEALDVEIFQDYGPTETTVAVTCWKYIPGHGHPKPPIGKPNSNVDVLIMDIQGRPVPPGMTGELWIGGAQTGRGYINNKEETKHKFVADPLEPGSDRRYYRTGDLARFLPDGNILFLGRMDDQLKVRGVRIELGDVSTALLRCEGVREAAVLPEPDGEGSNRLRAWVTIKDGFEGNESDIRAAMTELLPSYMVPFRIHVIDSIPLTQNGKTDQRALRALADEAGDVDEGLPLITETEFRLAALWTELLGVEVRHREADFFRLGGHSLAAMRLSGRIQKAFGVKVSLSDFYTDGRLCRLAARIDTDRGLGDGDVRLSDMPALLPGERVPMSWSQRRMWMLQQLLANPSSYHISLVFRIPAGRSASEACGFLHSMAAHHGILRTRLFQEGDSFWQQELPLSEWQLNWKELGADSPEECIGLMSDEQERAFDLTKEPGWRARWVSEKTGEALLLLIFHHALVDEWSMNLFRREFEALLTGKTSAEKLIKPAYSYIDFSRWQHWTFAQGLRVRLEAYWRERLSNLGEPVRLTTDLVPNNAAPGRNATVTILVDASLRKQMGDYCKREGLSRFAVWMAVWQILHSRLGNGEEVVLATPVSERDMLEWQDVMGMCLNTLPIRAKADRQASFRSFSRSCHSQLAQDLANDQFPYEAIVRLADGDLGTDGQGLPQVMFAWHGEYEWSEEDGLASGFPRKGSHAKNPISIHITDRREVCRISIHYDDALFLEQTTLKILQRYKAVARQVMEQPDMCISDIDILLPGEREYLRELSGRDHTIVHPETTLHSIFRKTVERYPDRPAVIDADGRETSYSELQGQAAKVAAFLRSKGIEREAIVAVHMQRSSKLLASMLGVMEVGGAFMLMEPGLPLDRLRSMADQARIAALVTDKAMPVIPEYLERTHRFDDILSADLAEEHVIDASSDPASLACVIFTSGSTGVPKGAMLEHGNLLNYLGEIKDTYSFGSEDRTLQKTLLSFDASLIELMLPMISGGSVVMPEPGVEADMRRLAGIAELHRVSYVFFAPAQLRFFLEIPGIERLNRSLRVIACGGESVPDSLVTKHLETLKASLYQIYGPTETSIAVAQWNCRSGHGQPKPPLGRPNWNVDILIMDDHDRPVPPGMPGELWIGGAQTGRGYINNEEETKKRFVTDPLETGSDRRYYRTGDLARFLPDGNILFLGRMDDQLKVRGVRIELGDVTAALLRCHGVREAIVLAEPDGEGSNRLRAWVTVKEDVEVNESLIRSSMADLLPGYMVPFRIHVIDSIPLTPHGKTDNRALRKMVENGGEETEGLPLLSPTEHRLAKIWSELLGTDVQHRDADFFRLGGHSLVVIRLLDTIKSSWGVRPDISAVFMNSSLESMARSIDTSTKTLRSKGLDVVITPEKVWDTGKGRHVFAFVGGAGSEEEFTKYHLIGRELGEGWRIHILPDPETSKGRFPTIGLDRLAEMYAKTMIPCCRDESVWLMGDCIGGLDAFAVAINLQSAGVLKPGLILMDSPVPGNVKSREVNQSEGLELYRDLPERAKPVREALFRSFLWLARFKPLRSLFHMRPRSRGQVLTMAMAYRLFDPADYSLRCPESGRTSEETFHHYLTVGRLKGEPPSDRFNGYRYAKHVDGFDLQGDDPVLHALLVGFREGYPRSRVLAYVESPNMKSDLMSARREIRRSFDVPVKYEGQVHMIVLGNVRKDERRPEWQKYVAGMVHVHHVDGDHRSYLKEKLVDTAKTIGRILAGTG